MLPKRSSNRPARAGPMPGRGPDAPSLKTKLLFEGVAYRALFDVQASTTISCSMRRSRVRFSAESFGSGIEAGTYVDQTTY